MIARLFEKYLQEKDGFGIYFWRLGVYTDDRQVHTDKYDMYCKHLRMRDFELSSHASVKLPLGSSILLRGIRNRLVSISSTVRDMTYNIVLKT